MELSVVVPTLNAEQSLVDCLDAITAAAPNAECIVVNGPSADGTSGMVAGRNDVSALVELADRNVNAARNAGIAMATGDVIAFVDGFTVIGTGWREALESAVDAGAAVMAGPVCHHDDDEGCEAPEQRRIGGRLVTYFDGGNVALEADLLNRLDGFDEYLAIGGARDAAHRLAGLDQSLDWVPALTAERSPNATRRTVYAWKYRSLAYRLVKNYGLRPSVAWRTFRSAIGDGRGELQSVLTGERLPSGWIGDGRDVLVNAIRGTGDGMIARVRDRSPARNPNGVSSRPDRAVQIHDWR